MFSTKQEGTGHPAIKFPPYSWDVWQSENHCCDEATTVRYVDKALLPTVRYVDKALLPTVRYVDKALLPTVRYVDKALLPTVRYVDKALLPTVRYVDKALLPTVRYVDKALLPTVRYVDKALLPTVRYVDKALLPFVHDKGKPWALKRTISRCLNFSFHSIRAQKTTALCEDLERMTSSEFLCLLNAPYVATP